MNTHGDCKARHDQVIDALDAMHARLARCAARCAGCGVPLLPDGGDAAVLTLTPRYSDTIAFCACRSCLLDAERRSAMLYAVEMRSKAQNRPAVPITHGGQELSSHNPSKRL
ncbi:hypothetical protein THICB3320132 [Thiomonas sp. CB3]|nr:hypothetical protein THICB3320132 [Thiomonas sp. CB3]